MRVTGCYLSYTKYEINICMDDLTNALFLNLHVPMGGGWRIGCSRACVVSSLARMDVEYQNVELAELVVQFDSTSSISLRHYLLPSFLPSFLMSIIFVDSYLGRTRELEVP